MRTTRRYKRNHDYGFATPHDRRASYAISHGQKWWDGSGWSWANSRTVYHSKAEALKDAHKVGGVAKQIAPNFEPRPVYANPRRYRKNPSRARVTIYKRARKVHGKNEWIVGTHGNHKYIAYDRKDIPCMRHSLFAVRTCRGGAGNWRTMETRIPLKSTRIATRTRRRESRFSRMHTKHSRSRV